MAIDQRDVSSTLRFMDDRALQQYAAMHKSDPYIFPLAFQESQNRQRLRMQQQGAQGMQPQPKVADAALQQMAPPQAQPMPETQGIGALPAGNMQGMADGGIAGYDDANFVGRSEPVVMMAEGGVARYAGEGASLVRMPYGQPTANMTGEIPGFVAGTSIFQTQPTVDEEEPFLRRLVRERTEAVEAQRTQEARVRAAKGQPLSAEDQARIAKADKSKAVADTSAQDMAQFDAASNLYMTERAAKQAADKPKALPTAEDKGKARPDLSAAPARRESADKGTAGIDALVSQFTRSTDLALGEGKNARVGFAASLEQVPKDRAERNANERAKEGDVFKGREDRLAEREKGIEGMGDKYLGLALLQAGAAMMSTPGNIGAALGKGIAVGSERYIAGIDKINAAKDKFADARDRLEDLRLNRADMTKKEIRDDQRAIDDGVLQAKKLLADGAGKDLEISNANQKAIFGVAADSLMKSEDRTSRERTANAQIAATLNTPDRLVFNQLLKDNGNDAVKAADALQKMKTEKFNMYDSYSKYLTGFAGKDPAMVGAPESITKYASRFAALTPPAAVDTTKPTRP